MLRPSPCRVLDDHDLPAVQALIERDPVANVFVASRVEAAGLDPWRLGAEMWGHAERGGSGELDALCFSGANLVPVGAGGPALRAFAERARRQGRRCSSIVGPAEPVLELWHLLYPHWGRARDVRPEQPLLIIDQAPQVPPDPLVRRVHPDELDLVLPACIAMFTEEVGVSPTAGDGGALYRARLGELIAAGRAFARIEGGEVLFKAELGAVSRSACQVQGVWVAPHLRGRGIGTTGTAAVVALALTEVTPVVSLYVNDFNAPARRAYERVGFRQAGTFASVLF